MKKLSLFILMILGINTGQNIQAIAQDTSISSAAAIYRKAKQELPPEYFVLYSIIDPIARANGLDNQPWRIVFSPEDIVNAAATDVNLLIFNAGLLDRLEGNASALACAVAHEMGHHVKQHIGYGPAKEAEAIAEVIGEANEQITEIGNNRKTRNILEGILGKGATDIILGKDENDHKKKEKVDEQAKAQINAKKIEISQTQEFDADESGYLYSVQAGFDPNGCISVMNILGRMPGAQQDGGSHPPPAKRSEQIRTLMNEYPPEQLKAQGQRQLQGSQTPLQYEIVKYQLPGGPMIPVLKVFSQSTEDDLCNFNPISCQ